MKDEQKAKPIMIYLAGPIDDVTVEQASEWRQSLSADFRSVLFFNPHTAYRNATMATAELVQLMNWHAIQHSHGVLANLSGPGRGFGTIREIEYSRLHGKPVAVVSHEDLPIVSLMSHDLFMHIDVGAAMEDLLQQIQNRRDRPSGMFMGLHFPGMQQIDPEEDDE